MPRRQRNITCFCTKSHDVKKAKKQNLLLYKEPSCQKGKGTEPASVQRAVMPRRQRNITCFCTKSHHAKKAKKQNLLLSEHKNEVSTKSHDVKKAKEQNLLLSEHKNEVSTKSHHAEKANKQNLLLYKVPSCQEGKGTEPASVQRAIMPRRQRNITCFCLNIRMK